MQQTTKRQLTTSVLTKLKKQLNCLKLNQSEFIMYNLVEKQSNLGFVNNSRLLILNTKNQSLSYLSKVPNTLIPFQCQEQVLSQIPKQKLSRKQVFEQGCEYNCRTNVEKLAIELKFSTKTKKIDWIFFFNNHQLMSIWFGHISFLFTRPQQQIDNFYHKAQQQKSNKIQQSLVQQIMPKQQEKKQVPEYLKQQQQNQYKVQTQQIQVEQTPSDKLQQTPIQILPKDQQQHISLVPVTNNDKNQNNQSEWKQKISQFNDDKQKQSEYHQFAQNMPLGQFVRQNSSPESDSKIQQSKQEYMISKQKQIQSKYFANSLNDFSNISRFNRKPLDFPPDSQQQSEQKIEIQVSPPPSMVNYNSNNTQKPKDQQRVQAGSIRKQLTPKQSIKNSHISEQHQNFKIDQVKYQSPKQQNPQILYQQSKKLLSQGKINQSITNSLQCLKYYQQNINDQYETKNEQNTMKFLQISELLLRSFELARRSQDSLGITSLCLERCKKVNSIKSFNRLIKIVLYPYLKKCDYKQSHYLLTLTEQLANIYNQSNWTIKNLEKYLLSHKLVEEMEKSIPRYFRKLKTYYETVEKQKIFAVYRLNYQNYLNNLEQKNQIIKFLNDLFLITNIVGLQYFQGFLKDTYYQ